MDAMRGDATLFTRNDEVEAQWRICDPIVQAWASRRRAAAAVRGRLAGPAGGRRAAARGPQLAGDLIDAAVSDAVWSEQGTTPDAIEAALRGLLDRAPRRERRLRAGARAEHGRVRRPRVERGDRQPPARRRALPRLAPGRALLRAAARAPGRARDDRLRGRARAGRARAAARDGDRRDRRAPPGRPADDRRPAGGHRPADAAVVAARPPRGGRRAARLAQAMLLDSIDEPVWARGDRARRRAVGARSTSWISRGCARRRGASGSPRPSTRRRCAPSCARSPAVTVRHHPESTVAAMLLLGWLASRLGWRLSPLARRRRRRSSGTRAGRRARRSKLRLQAAPEQQVPGLAGPHARDRLRHPAAPRPRRRGAARAPPRRRGRRARLDAARRLARRGRHPRRGHPPGAAARPHLRAGAARRPGDAASERASRADDPHDHHDA